MFQAECLSGHKVDSVENAIEATKQLLNLGPSIVIVTLGAKGVVYACKDDAPGHVEVPSVEVVDTTVCI